MTDVKNDQRMKINHKILKRYLNGTGKRGDREKIISWFSDEKCRDSLLGGYKEYWEGLSDGDCPENYDDEKALGKIYHQIKLGETKTPPKRTTKKGANKVLMYFSRAAAILFVPLAIYTLINSGHLAISDSNITYTELHAPRGTRAKFNLPDGSTGYLNGGSTLKYPAKFSKNNRKVSLNGEAYFDVVSNQRKPFIVSGPSINVVAYGTSFNVEAYQGDKFNKAVLVEGKIEVFGKTKKQIRSLGMLRPGDMCAFDARKPSYNITKVDARKIVSWKDGKLIFTNAPFGDVVKKLNRRYSANIVIKDKELMTYAYLATFEDETLDEILKLIQLSAPIEIKDLGRKSSSDGTYSERNIEFYLRKGN